MLQYWRDGFPPADPLRLIVWFLEIHTGNLFAYPVGGKNGASIATAVLFGLGLWTMWRKWAVPIRLMLLTPFLLTFIAAVLRLYPYGESSRVSQHFAPVVILLAAAGIALLIDIAPTPRAWRMRVNADGLLLVGIALVHITGIVIWPYKTLADQQMR